MPSPFSRYGVIILSIRTASISTSASWPVWAKRSGFGWISSDVSLTNIPIVVSLHIPVRSALRPQTIPPPARFLRLTIPFSLPCRRWGRARYFFPVFSPLCIFICCSVSSLQTPFTSVLWLKCHFYFDPARQSGRSHRWGRYSYTKAHFQRWRYQQFYLNPYQIQTGSIFVHYVACIFLVKNE